MMRKIIIVLLLGLFFLPSSSLAIGDQRCWKKTACIAAREKIIGSNSEAKDGFVSTKEDSTVAAACPNKVLDDEVGFCLPVGQTVTRISFGGTNKFLNIGEFIKFIYRYSMWAASIIAVMLVIVSGIQWTASGGNADMIGSAKKRIAGAISGLILLAFAYTILNTINPFLVNLRLPQVWLINEQGLSPPYCDQIKDNKTMLAYFKKEDEILKPEVEKGTVEKAVYTINPDPKKYKAADSNPKAMPKCGYEYFVDGTGGLSCKGTLCGPGWTCSDLTFADVKGGNLDKVSGSTCLRGNINVHFKVDSIFQELGASSKIGKFFIDVLENPDWIDDDSTVGGDTLIYPVCENNKVVTSIIAKPGSAITETIAYISPEKAPSLKNSKFGEYIYQLRLDKIKNISNLCGNAPIGFIFKVDIDTLWGSVNPLDNSMDASLYVGQKPGSREAILGTWDQVKGFPIPFQDAMTKGVFLNATLTDDDLETVNNNKGSEPAETEFIKVTDGSTPTPVPASASTDSD